MALVEIRTHIPLGTEDEIAEFIHHTAGLCNTVQQAKKKLDFMIRAGNKYTFLDDSFGGGLCLFLGTEYGESHWLKVLTKTTDKFQTFKQHFPNTAVPAPSRQYCGLKYEIHGAMLRYLRESNHAGLRERGQIDAGRPEMAMNMEN
ncbi:hypothetical protein K431DRAFT_293093 [Polychaeton citri CBS 116435]|uniref:Uncharacterized protein n=1 Tax=Polychaeton citri CBS 116435 TaxID=1314669 RepID=A0A9P4QDC1_9PEZI|nr:hypothetical protein K431DRAFT_293093 [Polychaeton citri CBS 116435]